MMSNIALQDLLPEWHSRAACKGHDHPDDWFPQPGDGLKTARARRVCRTCNVQKECLLDALRTREKFGIRAGWTPIQRARLLRKMASWKIAS